VYTPSQLQATAKKLTKGTSQYGAFIPSAWPIFLLYTSVFYQYGGKLFNISQKKATFNSKAGVQALTTLYNMIWKSHVSPANIGGTDPDMRMVATGQAAMVFDGPWQSQHPSIKAMGANAGIARFPQFGPKKAVAFYSHYLVMYSKNSAAENKAALKFAEYFNQHSILMAQAGDIPMYKPVLSSKAMKKLPAAALAASMKYAIPAGPSFAKYNDAALWSDAVTPALLGKLKPSGFAAALDKAATEVTKAAQG
jgi:multiple sugar transport system substrate-binding protein